MTELERGLVEMLDRPSSGSSGPRPARVQIHGGPTSIHAAITELERGTSLLGEHGESAAWLSARAGAGGALMSVAASQSSLAARVAQQAAELSLGLARIGAEALVLREGVHRSAAAYREAEARADAAMTKLLGLPALLVAAPLMLAGKEVPNRVSGVMFNALPDLIALGLNSVVGGLGGVFTVVASRHALQYRDEGRTGPLSPTEVLYPALHWVGSAAGAVQLGPVRVAGRTAQSRAELDGSLVGLMELQQRGQEAGAGEIQVAQVSTRTPGAPGQVYVVTLPGTQTWLGAEAEFTNPFDGGGILEAAVFDSQHVAEGVDEALRQSGAQEGDSVMLMGYSQGAMHAMRIANDPRITSRYTVEAVQTTGGPVEEMPLPETVEALNLADGEDTTAVVGGRPIHGGPHRTTVTFHGGGVADGGGLGEQHDFGNYLQHARDLQGTEEEVALAPTLDRFAALTAGSAVVHTYRLTREPVPEPKHPWERPAGDRRTSVRPVPAERPGESAARPGPLRHVDMTGRR